MSTPPQYPGSDGSGNNDDDPTRHDPQQPPPPAPYGGYGQQQPPQPAYGGYDQQSAQPTYGGYGQQPAHDPNNPYGTWQAGNDAGKGTDGLSIAAFVLSLTCCLSIVGVILGFVGLGRTKNGQRKGRWAAITAIIVGIVLTLVTIGAVILFWTTVKNVVTTGNAEAGMCINVEDDEDENTVYLTKKDCSDDHDAEIAFVSTFGDVESMINADEINQGATEERVAADVCRQLVDDDYASLGDDYEWGLASEDTESPGRSDRFLCYVGPADGKSSSKIG